jgi:hypothetical protein
MSNPFLTSNQVAGITGIFDQLFSSYGTGINNRVSIIKEPIKIVNNQSENVMPGFLPDAVDYSSITYQPVTGVFPAIIIYPHELKSQQFGQLKFNLDENQVMIKLQNDGANYMLNGKTEKVLVNGAFYSMADFTPKIQNYFGLKYYYFKLTSTK